MPDETKTAKALTYSVYKITPPNVGNNAERAESVLEKGLNYNVTFLAASTGSTFLHKVRITNMSLLWLM